MELPVVKRFRSQEMHGLKKDFWRQSVFSRQSCTICTFPWRKFIWRGYQNMDRKEEA